MKNFMRILVAVFVISVLFNMVSFDSTCSKLEQDVFRLHILANSDSRSDQQLKLMVRDSVIEYMSDKYSDCNTKSDAISVTKDNLENIKSVAQQQVYCCGYNYDVDVSIDNSFFDTRYYKQFTLPAGFYDNLRISIGNAQGKNWWCVMYPSLCVGAASTTQMKEDLSSSEYKVITADNIEYKFKIVEYFEKINLFFQ